MKILYIITRSTWGGAQAHVFDLVNEFKKRGNECVVVIGESGDLQKRLVDADIKVIILKNLLREINPLTDIKGIWELCKVIKRERPSVIHAHSSKAGIVGRIAARITRIPVVFTVHGWSFTEGVGDMKRKIYLLVEKLMANITDKFICVSDFDKELAIRYKVSTDQKLVAIHNGIPYVARQQRKENKQKEN
ncbi:glycosyltransferase [Bacillus sp. P14.5]|uniref:glycosyltransferase n=1 Tax=Bacillus sp. P14.5 TaxID=1983400 RepID=UPI0013B05E55|nr:glycosyltransferase [Bacillus sp. P14.5]